MHPEEKRSVPRIACLHTADSNIAIFAAAAARLGVDLVHTVRADLLAEAEAAGGVSDALRQRTAAALDDLAARADVVLLTCSTLGEGAVSPHLRSDAALAREAVRGGGRVAVLCAAPTTLAPTRAVFADAAAETGATITTQLVPGAWAAFRSGDHQAYLALIAAAARAAQADGARMIALAQASMAGAIALLPPDFPVRASPEAGLRAAIQGLTQQEFTA